MLIYRIYVLFMPEYHARCLAALPDGLLTLLLICFAVCTIYHYSPMQRYYPLDELLTDIGNWLEKVFDNDSTL